MNRNRHCWYPIQTIDGSSGMVAWELKSRSPQRASSVKFCMLPWKWILWKIGKLYPLFFLAFFKELSEDFLLVHDTKGHLILVNVQSASKVAGFNIYFNGSMIYRCETLRNLTPACGHPQHCRCEACLYVSLSLCLFILMKCKYSQLFRVLIDTVAWIMLL